MTRYDEDLSRAEQQNQDDRERCFEVTEVLKAYRKGLTSHEGLLILCRETGIPLTDLL